MREEWGSWVFAKGEDTHVQRITSELDTLSRGMRTSALQSSAWPNQQTLNQIKNRVTRVGKLGIAMRGDVSSDYAICGDCKCHLRITQDTAEAVCGTAYGFATLLPTASAP